MLIEDWFQQKLKSLKDDPEFQLETVLLELGEKGIHMKEYIDRELRLINYLTHRVEIENKNQIAKWGVQNRTAFEWLTYTTEELGELAQAISEYEYRDGTKEQVLKEAIQVATLALKIAEMFEVEI